MYQFLCLFGPAVLTWLLRSKYLKQNTGRNIDRHINRSIGRRQAEKGGKETVLGALIEIISYAFIQMVVILMVCKPLGRAQLTILSNGSLDIQYGSTAVFVSVCLSVIMGFTAVKDIHPYEESKDLKDEKGQALESKEN